MLGVWGRAALLSKKEEIDEIDEKILFSRIVSSVGSYKWECFLSQQL